MSAPLRFSLLIAAYMAAHVWLRVASSPTLDLDEAEQLVLSQCLQLGYGTQAPLFTWIQTLLIRVFGPNVFPLALLKSVLLAAIFTAGYAVAARLLPEARRSTAAASLFLLPYLVYQSLRDSSHSIILTLACTLSLWLILRLADRRDTAGYLALGACLAAGCLSKYNFALFLIPAAIATIAVPEFRPIVRDPRILLTAAVAIALVAPHAVWLAGHFDAATAGSFEKLKAKELSAFRSLAKLAECLFRFAAVALVAFAVAFPRFWLKAGDRSPRPNSRWLGWFIGSGLVGLGVMMVASRATDLSERWLLPLLFCLPIALYLRATDLTPIAERRFAWCLGIAATAVPVALAAHVFLGPALGHPIRKSIDFSPVLHIAVTRDAPRTILAQNFFLAGNLKRLFPRAQIRVPGQFSPPGSVTGPTWVVWQSKSSGFRREVAGIIGMPWDRLQPQALDLPYFHAAGTDPARVFVAILE